MTNDVIRFRAKTVDTNCWVYGYYVRYGRKFYIYTGEVDEYDSPVHFEIDVSTLGRLTGIKDERGNWIFEGDILKWNEREWGCPYCEAAKFDYDLLNMRQNDWSEWCTVIGNKWDNPELLNS